MPTFIKRRFLSPLIYGTKKNGEKFEENYDKLVLATGSLPISPAFSGNDLEGLKFLKLFQEGQEVDKEISNPDVKEVAVIGAGYIGVEIAEACLLRGKKVSVQQVHTKV